MIYLLKTLTDKKELLSKLKILAINKKIKIKYNKKHYKKSSNVVEEKIIKTIFAILDFEELILPIDLIEYLDLENKIYRIICNWFFKNATIDTRRSDRIIKFICNIFHDLNKPNINDKKYKAEQINELQNETNEFTLSEMTNISQNIDDVDIQVLENYDRLIETRLKNRKESESNGVSMINRCVEVIKILIENNGTKKIKLLGNLNELLKMQNELSLNKNEKVPLLIKLFFKQLRLKKPKSIMKGFIKEFKKDTKLLRYINLIIKYCKENDVLFKWETVLKIICKNPAIKNNLQHIDYSKIPTKIFIKSLVKAKNIKRFKNLMKNIIRNENEKDILLYCKKKYENDINLNRINFKVLVDHKLFTLDEHK